MADTRSVSQLTPELWDEDFSTEYFQTNPMAAYAGTSSNNPIVMKEDLASRRASGISYEFIRRLTPGAKLDRAPLKGYEQRLGEYGDKVTWNVRKEAISIHEMDTDLAAINLREASRSALKDWADEDVKFQTIINLMSVGTLSNLLYDASLATIGGTGTVATAADRNAWDLANPDRILYARAVNRTLGNHGASLANITAGQTLNRAAVGGLKRLAAIANPKVTPIKVTEKNKRVYVLFVHPFTMRDIRADLETARQNVSVVEQNNGIFLGGDVEYDGVLIHEVDDMPLINNGTINVAPAFLVGQEAIGWGIKSRFRTREDEDDYGQVMGIGMIGKWGMKKLVWNFGTADASIIGRQRGVVSAFFPAVAD